VLGRSNGQDNLEGVQPITHAMTSHRRTNQVLYPGITAASRVENAESIEASRRRHWRWLVGEDVQVEAMLLSLAACGELEEDFVRIRGDVAFEYASKDQTWSECAYWPIICMSKPHTRIGSLFGG
jgi:hypothetical protein